MGISFFLLLCSLERNHFRAGILGPEHSGKNRQKNQSGSPTQRPIEKTNTMTPPVMLYLNLAS
jgi:hypothetical protein